MSDVLRSKLSAVRTRSLLVDTLEGICRILIFLPVGLTVIMLLDWWLELPYAARAVAAALLLGGFAYLVFKGLIQPALHVPDEDELALRVEQSTPSLGSRLIAAIQLTRANAVGAGASISLVHALVAETESLTAAINFAGVVKLDRLKKSASIAAVVIVLAAAAMALAGNAGRDLLERAMLVPGVEVPRHTHVTLLTPNPLVIGVGDRVELRARAVGVVPPDGYATIWYDGQSNPAEVKLDPIADLPGGSSSQPADASGGPHDVFAAVIPAVSQSFTYRIHLNDGQSDDARVRAAVRPAVVSLKFTQTYPAYTHAPPAIRAPDDLQLLAGSLISIDATSSSMLRGATADAGASSHVVFHCKSGDVVKALTPSGGRGLQLETATPMPVPADATGIAIVLVDADGLSSGDPVVYPVTVLPDQPPTVTVTYPVKKEELSTPLAKLLVGVDAKDDFALGSVRLCYRVIPPDQQQAASDQLANAAMAAVTPENTKPSGTIELRLHGTPAELKGRFFFDLSSLHPRPVEGGAVEWWLEAQDTNNVTGPGKAASDHFLTRIASEAQVRAELYGQLSERMAELKETADSQKKDNADLGDLIQQQVP